jgi:hypothetical protein
MVSVTSVIVALLVVLQQELIFQTFQEEGIVTPSEPRGAAARRGNEGDRAVLGTAQLALAVTSPE